MFNKKFFLTFWLTISFFASALVTPPLLKGTGGIAFGQISPSQQQRAKAVSPPPILPRRGGGNLAPKTVPKRAVAVITFENLSAFPENDWVGAGFAESLTTKLAKLETIDIIERRQLNVVLKESGLEQKQVSEAHWEKAQNVGKTLFSLRGVEYLLIGSVQMTGKYDNPEASLSVNARTVKVETAEVTKGEATGLSGKVADLFGLQTKLAEWFVQTLGIQPSSAEKKVLKEKETESIASYRLYILGQQYLDEGKLSEAKAAFWEAAQPTNFPVALLAWAEASRQEILEREQTGVRDTTLRSEFTASAREIASQGAVGIYVLGLESEFNGKYDDALKHYRAFLDYTQSKVVKWKVETGYCSVPAIWQGRVYMSADDAIHAFDAKTGTLLWSSSRFPYALSQPVVSEGTVFFSLSSVTSEKERYGALIALDAQTGALLWQFKQTDTFYDIPTVAGDVVYVCSRHSPRTSEDSNFLYAVNRRDGQLLWKATVGWRGWLDPPFVVFDGVVYLKQIIFRLDDTTGQCFVKSATLVALDAKSGQMLWQFDLPLPKEKPKQRLDTSFVGMYGPPSVSEEVVAVTWRDEVLYVLDRKTGKLLWKRERWSDLILASGLIYDGSAAYNAKTGELRWQTKVGAKPSKLLGFELNLGLGAASVFAAADGTVFARGGAVEERRVYALESQTGALRWQYDVQEDYVSRILVAEGAVYLLTGFGGPAEKQQLHALSEKSGELLWIFDLTSPKYTSVSFEAQDGIVYVSTGKTLYALTGGERGRATPSDLDAQISIGRTLRLKGELKEAQTALQKVVDAKPNLPEAWLELAKVSEGLGEVHQTVKSWNRVSQYVSPLDVRYQMAIERLKEGAGLLWRYETQEQFRDDPRKLFSIKEGILYAGGYDTHFYALDAQQGRLLWKSVDTMDWPIMGEDAVYDGGERGECSLHALDLKNGKTIWKSDLTRVFFWEFWIRKKTDLHPIPFAVSEGVVLTGGSKVLGAFSAKDGTLLWKTSFKSSLPDYAVLIKQGLVYLVQEPDENEASSPRRLTVSALELQTGKPLWQYETENLMLPLFASDKVIYLLSDILYALESKTGKLLWKYEAKNAFDRWGWLGLPIVVQDGVIYGMHALNAKTGAQLWTARTRNFRPVQISSEILYGYENNGDNFSALKASSGELLWSFKPSPESRLLSHALSDHILYLGSQDSLYALDAKTGSPIWSYEVGAGVMAICVSEGVLYMLTSDGAISAFDLKKAASKLQPSPR